MSQLGVLGSTGRMGKQVIQLVQSQYTDAFTFYAEINENNKDWDFISQCDMVIDFSLPHVTLDFIEHCETKQSFPYLVSGSTGWTEEQWAKVKAYAEKTPVFYASNFSYGIFFLKKMLSQLSYALHSFHYTPVLIDKHHQHKKDAPSGTAKTLKSVIEDRTDEPLQLCSIRAGEIIGEHDIHFYGQADEVYFGHRAQDRTLFARGAIEASLWLLKQSKQTGLFGMEDWLNPFLEKGDSK